MPQSEMNASDMEIRVEEASPKEIPRIVEIALQAFWREYPSYEEAEKVYREHVTTRWSRQLERHHATVLVAKLKGQIVGYLVFRWWFGWNGWAESIAVDEKYRRRGIGTRLMQALQKKAGEEGYQKICYAFDPGQPTDRFFDKFTPQRFGEIEDRDLNRSLPLFFVNVR